jgi:hypothetical protein
MLGKSHLNIFWDNSFKVWINVCNIRFVLFLKIHEDLVLAFRMLKLKYRWKFQFHMLTSDIYVKGNIIVSWPLVEDHHRVEHIDCVRVRVNLKIYKGTWFLCVKCRHENNIRSTLVSTLFIKFGSLF